MRPFLYYFFHSTTSDRTDGGNVQIPLDPTDWPESWKDVEHKTYNIIRPIKLPEIKPTPLSNILSRRKSDKSLFGANKLSLEKLATLLTHGYGLRSKNEKTHRTVPSAGARYPLELYVCIFKDVDDLQSGIYHYNIGDHTLEPIIEKKFSPDEILAFAPAHAWLSGASGTIHISSIFDRTTRKYGNRGYRYVLLEAGHVAQNLLLSGVENGLTLIPIGGVDEETVEQAIGMNSSVERVVYSIYL